MLSLPSRWRPWRADSQHLAQVPIPADVEDRDLSLGRRWGGSGAMRFAPARRRGPAAVFLAGAARDVLNVRGRDALLAAVRRCWISLFTDLAVLYRMRNRIPQRLAAMAVTVQQMVSADAAGVVFTADPLTGDRGRIVIEATWGLGETLVSGKVAPDRIVLDKRTFHVIESSVGRKTIEIVPDMAGASRVNRRSSPDDRINRAWTNRSPDSSGSWRARQSVSLAVRKISNGRAAAAVYSCCNRVPSPSCR